MYLHGNIEEKFDDSITYAKNIRRERKQEVRLFVFGNHREGEISYGKDKELENLVSTGRSQLIWRGPNNGRRLLFDRTRILFRHVGRTSSKTNPARKLFQSALLNRRYFPISN